MKREGKGNRQVVQQSLRRAGLINLDTLPANLDRVIITSLDLVVDTELCYSHVSITHYHLTK